MSGVGGWIGRTWDVSGRSLCYGRGLLRWKGGRERGSWRKLISWKIALVYYMNTLL